MIRLALMPHPEKEEALKLTAQLIDKLSAEDAVLWLEPTAASKLGRDDLAGRIEMLKTCDIALVLGGDGALLKAARLVAPWHVPVLGVNFGHLGFLMATEPDGVDRALDRLFAGDFHIEERLMLVATADDGGGGEQSQGATEAPAVGEGERLQSGRRSGSFIGLNDAVVARGPFARVLEFEIDVDGTPAGRFFADGVIVSTPTGSTGYSLSAGGPIIHPQVEALIVTPICPHTVGVRGFVTRPDEEVTIRVVSPNGEAMLTVDGQGGQPLKNGSRVTVRRAKDRARFVSFGDRSFYSLLRQRLRQGNG